ncbi:hypothetical protein FRC10_000108 [Ceratobasidium sp. 414]|nr:hypothetical protein FRC10_000108 [Ceratobasidium sp. 414]
MTLLTSTRTVVVLGASYGGHRAVQILLQVLPSDWRIVVIERNTHFNHLYAFPRLAVVEGHEHKAFIPYTNIFKILNLEQRQLDDPVSSGHELVHAHVTRIEKTRVFYTRISPGVVPGSSVEHSVDYDYLIYALGSHLPSPINVWADPLSVHGQSDLPKINSHGEKPEGTSWLRAAQARVKEAHSVLVVGGGALGVQFASDVAALYPQKDITLVHSGACLLPRFGEWMHNAAMEGLKELGVTVLLSSRVDLASAKDHDGKRTLQTVDGRRVGAELVVRLPIHFLLPRLIPDKSSSAQANAPTPLLARLSPASVSPQTGLVDVLRSMQVGPGLGTPHIGGPEPVSPMSHIFVIGDAADAFGALNAGHTAWAEIAARNVGRLVRASDEELERYVAPPHAIKVSLGLDRAIYQSRGEYGRRGPDECALDLNAPSMWTRRGLSTDDMTV